MTLSPEFENRFRPEEITSEIRHHIEEREWYSEVLWLGTGVVLIAAFSLFFSLAYRITGFPPTAEIPFILGFIACGLVSLAAVHLRFRSRRNFVEEMPAAPALIVGIEDTYRYSEDGAGHIERLRLNYLPTQRTVPRELLAISSDVQKVSAEVGTRWTPFVEHLQKGKMVSILYDPKHPKHVRVVEEEHDLVAM